MSTKNYPYPFFKNKNYKTKSFNSFEVNVTNDWNYCGDIKFPCVENLHFEALSKIFYKNGYTFFISDKNKKISNINIEQNRMLYKINN